jgi:hypothetical protein
MTLRYFSAEVTRGRLLWRASDLTHGIRDFHGERRFALTQAQLERKLIRWARSEARRYGVPSFKLEFFLYPRFGYDKPYRVVEEDVPETVEGHRLYGLRDGVDV